MLSITYKLLIQYIFNLTQHTEAFQIHEVNVCIFNYNYVYLCVCNVDLIHNYMYIAAY